MRILAAVVALLLAACSGTGNGVADPPKPECAAGAVVACDGGWATCSAGGELGGCVLGPRPTSADDAGSSDASAEACAALPVSSQTLGVDCEPLPGACSCVGGVRYRCTAPDYFAQPSTGVLLGGTGVPGGCRTLVQGHDVSQPTEHCCAAACVRTASRDAACSPGHTNAYTCAPGAMPKAGCVAVGDGYCCGE